MIFNSGDDIINVISKKLISKWSNGRFNFS
jgi:hypothetical protein